MVILLLTRTIFPFHHSPNYSHVDTLKYSNLQALIASTLIEAVCLLCQLYYIFAYPS